MIVPANGSLPNIVLSPRAVAADARLLEREQFDLLHVHEPLTPVICVAALAYARCPIVATFHAAGDLALDARRRYGLGLPARPGRRPDRRLGAGAESAARWLGPGTSRSSRTASLDPAGTPTPATASTPIVFVGRHDARKGLPVLLEAPGRTCTRRTGARLRLVGADPLPSGSAPRPGCASTGRDRRARLPLAGGCSRASCSPRRSSPRRRSAVESFGMVLTRAFAVRDAGGRLGHPRVPGRDDRRAGTARAAGRRPGARRCARRAARRRAAAPLRSAGAPRRSLEERYAWADDRRNGSRRSTSGSRRERRGRGVRLARPGRGSGIAVSSLCGVGACSGGAARTGTVVRDTFTVVELAVGRRRRRAQPALRRRRARSPGRRSSARRSRTPRPGSGSSSRPSRVGLFANAVLPGRVGELARVAVLTRRMPGARRASGRRCVGTVFAHRVFDLVPIADARRLRAA